MVGARETLPRLRLQNPRNRRSDCVSSRHSIPARRRPGHPLLARLYTRPIGRALLVACYSQLLLVAYFCHTLPAD